MEQQTNETQRQSQLELDADAMRFLYELGCRSREYSVQDIGGATYVNTAKENPLVRVKPYENPDPENMSGIYTLSGLVDYLKNDVDGHFARYSELQALVANFDLVEVWSPVHGAERVRSKLASCHFERPAIRLNQYMDQESFSVMVQTHFDAGENRDRVLQITGNLRLENDATLADDGVTQCVTMRSGISRVSDVQIVNPILLAPHRIFPEIEQPSSPFILRVRKGDEGAEIALFEADSAAWKADAVRMIGIWLREQLAETKTVIIA